MRRGVDEAAEHGLDVPGWLLKNADVRHAERAGLLSVAHRGQFDRMLIAQAHADDLRPAINDDLPMSPAAVDAGERSGAQEGFDAADR